MNHLFTQAVAEAQAKIEGGAPAVDWPSLANQAMLVMSTKINARGASRRVDVYGGVATDLRIYTCPDDINVPAEFYPDNNAGQGYKYKPPKVFYRTDEAGYFTIDHMEGGKYLVARPWDGQAITLVDTTATGWGGVVPVRTARTFMTGNSALKFSLPAGDSVISRVLETVDLTEYSEGVLTIPIWINDMNGIDFSTLTFKLTTSLGSFDLSPSMGGLNTQYFNGWNILRFDMSQKEATGTPDITQIMGVTIEVTAREAVDIVTDKIQLHKTQSASFRYYSYNIFQDDQGVFKASPIGNNDVVVLEEDEYRIWFYELVTLAAQEATRNGGEGKEDFSDMLNSLYEQYNAKAPSMQEPISYNVGPGIRRESDIYGYPRFDNDTNNADYQSGQLNIQ